MKFVFAAIFSTIFLGTTSAQAFISNDDQDLLLATLNESVLSNDGQTHFEDVRCSLRSRLCIIKMSVGPKAEKAGCMIERISDSSDIFTTSAGGNGEMRMDLSSYAQNTIAQCVTQLAR